MDNEELDIKLKATLVESITEFNKLDKTATAFGNTIVKINRQLDSFGNLSKITQTITDINNKGNKIKNTFSNSGELISTSITKSTKNVSNLKTTLSSAFNVNKLYLYWNLTKRLRSTISGLVTSAIDYKETENKFNVSMGSARHEATKFVNKMSEAVGIAKAELMDYQATFKNILSGLGSLTDKQSETISESLSKMALDYSSLYNVKQADAMEKFQSALVGSIRPIRSDSGYDVSEATLSNKLNELGIERSVSKLNQMEKRILRIIVLMDQMRRTGAMNDLARTIEEPANQLRVLKAQIQETGVWLGNVFMGTLGNVLPYINAFVMVIKELIKMLAIFTGYVGDDTNLSDVFESVEDSTSGISSNLGNANKKAKELKKTLFSFDVLNVINTPTESKGSGGSGGVGTIDPKILGALKDYDSIMENVRMKATDIRDKIMDWLGYTKIIDPLTGEVSWKLKEGYQNIEKIRDALETIGIIFAGYKISSTVIDFLDKIGKISNKKQDLKIALGISIVIAGTHLIYKGINKAIDQGYLDKETIIETISGGALVFSAGKFLLGLSIAASALLTVDIIGAVFLYKMKKVGKETLAGRLAEEYLPSELSIMVQTNIGLSKVVWKGLEQLLPEEQLNKLWKEMMKRVIKKVAEYVRNIPLIGKSMADAIMNGLEASEDNIANSITYTNKGALEKANPWVKQGGEELGRDTAKAYNSGFSGEESNTTNLTTNTIRKSLSETQNNTRIDAYNLGSDLNTKASEGFASEKENTREIMEQTIANSLSLAQENMNTNSRNSGNEAGKSWAKGLNEQKENIKRTSEKIGSSSGTVGGSSFNNFFRTNVLKNRLSLSDLVGNNTDWSRKGQTASTAFWKNFQSGKVSISTNNDGGAQIKVRGTGKYVSAWASGGFPDIGELFMAREAGPELVGRIGNRNSVVNNDQIVQSVSQGVAQAVAQVLVNRQTGGQFNFYLDSDEIMARVEEKINRNANIYGMA